jgi:hypothetical protein
MQRIGTIVQTFSSTGANYFLISGYLRASGERIEEIPGRRRGTVATFSFAVAGLSSRAFRESTTAQDCHNHRAQALS